MRETRESGVDRGIEKCPLPRRKVVFATNVRRQRERDVAGDVRQVGIFPASDAPAVLVARQRADDRALVVRRASTDDARS